MRFLALALVAVLFGTTVLSDTDPAFAVGNEPSTSTIRIRLKGPTLRVRCRGGDCTISVVRTGTSYAVSITRVRDGESFTFNRTVENPTNVAVETGAGNDSITLVDLAVPGFLRVATKFGDDVLDISATSTAGKTSIDTGPGNDTVLLQPGTFGGKFALVTHGGNDAVAIEGGLFTGKAGFDGGPGTDSFLTSTQPFTQPPVIRGFEQ